MIKEINLYVLIFKMFITYEYTIFKFCWSLLEDFREEIILHDEFKIELSELGDGLDWIINLYD